MRKKEFLRLIFMLLAIVSAAMMFPAAVAWYYGEYQVLPSFLIPAGVCFAVSALLSIRKNKEKIQLTIKGGFLIVAAGWTAAGVLGAIPLLASGAVHTFSDALFESISGFTTTGATVINDLESLPRSINLWRMETHWLGGMGIVALTVALLPLLGVGGFRLIKSETTGPEKGKITPKITETAKILWLIYAAFTILQTVLLMIAGMDFIDAVSHSFATLGTGGFSSRNASIGSFDSPSIDWICMVFMFLSGINFSLYYWVLIGKRGELLQNTEIKAYCLINAVAGLIISLSLLPSYHSTEAAFRAGFFQTVSIMTTTGFSTADFGQWQPVPQAVLFVLMFIGGCSGSTGGGIKVIRWVVAAKQMTSEMRKMLHPHGVFSIRLNGKSYSHEIVQTVMGFIFLYAILLTITTFVAAADGADLITSFTTALSMLGNIGPGFGKVGPSHTFAAYSAGAKWFFSFAMMAGRLELYTMTIFFLPSFWKK